jgi:uncharacterized phage protein gp47/JayE
MADVDFRKIMQSAGLPTTKQDLQNQWQQQLVEQGDPINNDSQWSPFRRLIDAIVVKPALAILDGIAEVNLPSQFVQTATGQSLLLKGADVNLQKNAATKAKWALTVTRDDSSPTLTIEAGTVVQTPQISGVNYQLVITQSVTMAIGVLIVTVFAEAQNTGAAYNLPVGYYSVLVEPIAGVSITNALDGLVLPGTDRETDEDFRLRIANQFNLVGEYHTDAVYKGMISAVFGINSQDMVFEHNAPRGPGTANCFILLPVGNVSTEFIAQINDYINTDGNHGHGDDLQVFAIAETLHPITIDLWLEAGTSELAKAKLAHNVESFIRCAFRENQAFILTTTMPGEVFSFSQLTTELHGQFPLIKRLAFDQPDIAGGASIARIETLTVNTNG